MGTIRSLLILALACTPLTACAHHGARGSAESERSLVAPPHEPLGVELIAWTLIPPEHEEFGRIGGLSGAVIMPSPPEDQAAPLMMISDSPNTTSTYNGALALTANGDTYTVLIKLLDQRDSPARHADAEAIAMRSYPGRFRDNTDFIRTYESPPTIEMTEVRPAYRWQQRTGVLELPDGFADRVRPNRGFEATAFMGTELWVATECAIEGDGDEATPDAGTLCTILTTPRPGLQPGTPLAETYHYRTDPMPPHLGNGFALHSLVEFCALPDGRLLALERSLTFPAGFGAKLFVLDGTARTEPGARLPVLNKTLIADLGAIARDAGLAWIGNLEAMALGPTVTELTGDPEETGRLLLVIADDNFGADIQKTGSQALAFRLTGVP